MQASGHRRNRPSSYLRTRRFPTRPATAPDESKRCGAWAGRGAAVTGYRYRVTARGGTGLGTPSAEATGRTRPQAALSATAAYPLTAPR